MTCIGTKRGKNYGLVYDRTGTVIGRVFRAAKVAAGTKGARQSFWTANVIVDGVECHASLGTRHPSRWSGARAIVKFHASYPADRIILAAAHGPFPLYGGSNPRRSALVATMNQAAAQFKYDNWQVCALTVRNLANPRAGR